MYGDKLNSTSGGDHSTGYTNMESLRCIPKLIQCYRSIIPQLKKERREEKRGEEGRGGEGRAGERRGGFWPGNQTLVPTLIGENCSSIP